jgi:hypothetical protein
MDLCGQPLFAVIADANGRAVLPVPADAVSRTGDFEGGQGHGEFLVDEN